MQNGLWLKFRYSIIFLYINKKIERESFPSNYIVVHYEHGVYLLSNWYLISMATHSDTTYIVKNVTKLLSKLETEGLLIIVNR